MKKGFLFVLLFAVFFVVFLTGCATSPFPNVTESGVIVQTIAQGRPMENINIGVQVTNNTSDYIGNVRVSLVSINGNDNLAPFELWKSKREADLREVANTTTLDSGKSSTFYFRVTSYNYLEPKAYPMVINVTYRDANGIDKTITKNSVIEVLAPNGFYKFMRDIIDWIYRLVRNYGVAIIILTLIVKLVSHPLTRSQLRSTARISELQPEMKKIQEKYRDNPQKMNQEISRLYKEHNVSMMGGCLPLIVQLPIFFILYGALQNYSPFNTSAFLWLKDLNTPDPYYVLPVLVFISMFLQSKSSQVPGSPPDPNTRMMTYFLPAIFGFMSIQWAPSILIYWITFSLAQVGESKLILRRLSPVPSTISSDVERPKEMKEIDSIVREDKAKAQPSKKEKKQVTEESQMRKQKEGGKKKSGGTKEKK